MRNKAAVEASGIDPGMRRLFRLYAIRTSRRYALQRAQENLDKAQASIENYWAEVNEALEDQEAIADAHP